MSKIPTNEELRHREAVHLGKHVDSLVVVIARELGLDVEAVMANPMAHLAEAWTEREHHLDQIMRIDGAMQEAVVVGWERNMAVRSIAAAIGASPRQVEYTLKKARTAKDPRALRRHHSRPVEIHKQRDDEIREFGYVVS